MARTDLQAWDGGAKRLSIELTSACDHRCFHCYNVWNTRQEDPYPRGQLPADALLPLLSQVVSDCGAEQLSLTGGEPLLRPDALSVIERACDLATVHLVTNGAHLSPDVVKRMATARVQLVQLTLLSAKRARHDALKGVASFDETTRAILDLQDAGITVQLCFVSTRANAPELEGVLELCYAMGIRSLSYNRMSPAGAATEQLRELLPDPASVEANLASAERLGRRYGISVATAMPIPPCLIRLDRYPSVRFGYCSIGTTEPTPVIDPLGNVRACNLSSELLGNLGNDSWEVISARLRKRAASYELPPLCRDCAHRRSCRGGCRESALATFGETGQIEPFVRQATDASWRRETLDK